MMVKKVFYVLVGIPAFLFVGAGLRWLFEPSAVAPDLGLTLDTGLGLSSQIGDLASFFLTTGLCMIFGLISGRKLWFYPPAMLLLFAAAGRTVAWLLHDAVLAWQLISLEIVLALVLMAASRFYPTKTQ